MQSSLSTSREYHVTDISTFRNRLAELPDLCAAAPEAFGEGVNLLLSCRSRDLRYALAEAETRGIAARGVGRMHILIEIENALPDKDWVETMGSAIAHYFERIGGTDPQIGIDRNS